MSISQLFPEEGPTLSLNFAGSRTLDPRITFTRTSTGTYMGSDGLIKVAPANSPRFDHRYVNGEIESLGLLVEEQRINYTINSEDLSLWTSTANMIPTGNAILLPNGNISTAVEYRGETTEANTKLLRPSPSGSGVTAGDTWVFSVFLRAGTEQTCHIALLDRFNSGSTGRTFDMVNGVFVGTQGYAGTVTGGQTGVEKYSNGWYRAWISGIFTADEPQGHQIYLRLNANSGSIPLTTSFSAWGSQLEKGSFPTSYIPTSGSTATRTADNASMTGSNFSSWFNQGDGTFFINGSAPYQFQRSFGVSAFNTATSGDNRLSIRMGNTFMRTNAAEQFGFYQAQTNNYKVAVAYGTNTASQVLNAVIAGTDTSVITPSNFDVMEIGKVEGNTSLYTNGTISQLTYYPTRLTNTQLQTLTR